MRRAALVFLLTLTASSLAFADSMWPKLKVGNVGDRYNATARKLDISSRVVRGKCTANSCPYSGPDVHFLAGGGAATAALTEVFLVLGEDTNPLALILSIGTMIAMFEPDADPNERGAALKQINRQMDAANDGKKADAFTIRQTNIGFVLLKGIGAYITFSKAP